MAKRQPCEIGQRYGTLTIIKELESRKTKSGDIKRYVLCKCDCGKEVTRSLYGLRITKNSNCGCLRRSKIEVGDRFGKLTILSEDESYRNKDGIRQRKFLCRCDCGRDVIKKIPELKTHPYCPYCKNEEVKIPSLPNEIWKDIEGYEGLYQISNLGRVKALSVTTKFGERIKVYPERLKSTNANKMGYPSVMLSKNGKDKLCTLHRLLAKAFIPNPENKPEIDHINRDRSDFRLENLRWVTHKENYRLNEHTLRKMSESRIKALANGAKTIAYEKRFKIAVDQFDLDGNYIATFPSMNAASKVARADAIGYVCKGLRKQAGGYLWKYSNK